MTAFADLVLPDTTYLERHDAMSMLDRPISEFDGPADSVRVPVLPPKGQCKPFQEVLVELAGRLKLPAFTNADGSRRFRDYPDFVVNFETRPGSGVGFLAGWRGADGSQSMKGEPNPRQWEMYAANNCVFHHKLPPEHQYMRNCNKGYNEWARAMRLRTYTEPALIQVYSEVLQEFRLAAPGAPAGAASPRSTCARASRSTATRCPSTTRPSSRRRPTSSAIPSMRSRSGPWRCTTRGTRRTRGCARSTPTTTSS